LLNLLGTTLLSFLKTRTKNSLIAVGCDPFRDRFGYRLRQNRPLGRVRFRRVRRLALPDAAAEARGMGEEMRKLSNR
jgi:hypothetical protein